jgi:uncharacterized protein
VNFITEETKKMMNKVVDEEMVTIYDKHFTHPEIKDIIIFYETPTGQKMLKETPAITKEMMDAMLTNHLPGFQERVTKKIEEMTM